MLSSFPVWYQANRDKVFTAAAVSAITKCCFAVVASSLPKFVHSRTAVVGMFSLLPFLIPFSLAVRH